jgi:hypothetical protein
LLLLKQSFELLYAFVLGGSVLLQRFGMGGGLLLQSGAVLFGKVLHKLVHPSRRSGFGVRIHGKGFSLKGSKRSAGR